MSEDPASPSPFPARSPRTGDELEPVRATAIDSLPELTSKARRAADRFADTTFAERIRAMGTVKKRLLERADEIAELLHAECGKPIEEALLAEVLPNADLLDYWSASIEELMDPVSLSLDPISFPGKSGTVYRVPRGVMALITPWNYPVAIPLRTLVPALLAGNAVLFKPSEITPRAGALVASLFEGVLPDGLLTLVQGGGDVGDALLDQNIDLVVFTGSVKTGRAIARRAADKLIPCSLELGGKDAAIVCPDAPIERTVAGVVWGAFTNAGQNCASIERVYVDQSIYEPFVEQVVALTKQLNAERDLSCVTTKRQRDVIAAQIDDAQEKGAEILVGGMPEDPDDLMIPPTVIAVRDESTTLMTEETFGPVLPLVKVDSVEDAIDKTNASPFGLTTSLWSADTRGAHGMASLLKSGIVTINNHGFTAAIAEAPWTGTGQSGFGVTNGPHALSEMTRPRLVLEDRNRGKRELWWYPYTDALRDVARSMASVRGGGSIGSRVAAVGRLLRAFPRRAFKE